LIDFTILFYHFNDLGVTLLRKVGNLSDRLFAPFSQQGRAIRATSVASFYPSRGLREMRNLVF